MFSISKLVSGIVALSYLSVSAVQIDVKQQHMCIDTDGDGWCDTYSRDGVHSMTKYAASPAACSSCTTTCANGICESDCGSCASGDCCGDSCGCQTSASCCADGNCCGTDSCTSGCCSSATACADCPSGDCGCTSTQ